MELCNCLECVELGHNTHRREDVQPVELAGDEQQVEVE
jgi:hypothetical protein